MVHIQGVNYMNFSISIRFRGGDFDPKIISEALNMTADRTSLDEDFKRKGRCYWTKKIKPEPDLITTLYTVTDALWIKRDFIMSLKGSGVSCGLFIGINVGPSFGFEIPCDLLDRLRIIGLQMDFDLYP